MSIRVTVLSFIVIWLSGYAWAKNWFFSLCGMIVLMSFLEHRDMPRSIAGIQGLNLWNILFLNVLLAWLAQRHNEGLKWDMSRLLLFSICIYWIVVIASFIRIIADPSEYYNSSFAKNFVDKIINPAKFFLPCVLLYDGCRKKDRVIWALVSILIAYFLLGVQTIKYMGLTLDMSGEALSDRAIRVLDKMMGFHRVDLSMMLAGASWATVAFAVFVENKVQKYTLFGAAGIIVLAQALTGGRMGYVTWGLIGFILSVLKWRSLIPLMPIGVLVILILAPGVRERMLSGFGHGESQQSQDSMDIQAVTSGRAAVWPLVIEKIKDSPFLGYGGEAMIRTGLANWIEIEKNNSEELSGGFGHPHNAYLEQLFDNGILGFICIIPIYYISCKIALSLFLDSNYKICEVVGGVALTFMLALLIAGMGSQTLYPREGVFGMWAAIGLSWRVFREREITTKTQIKFVTAEV